jgi:hypothetical protein
MTPKEQTPERLLMPRFKVIATFPRCWHSVGEILQPDKDGFFEVWQDEYMDFHYVDCYPHLFRKLSWWEDREISEMPEYVKNSKGEIVKVVGLETNGLFYEKANSMEGKMWTRYSYCMPATHEEYISYLNKVKSDNKI